MPLKGYLDSCAADLLAGWAWDSDDPARRLIIEILVDGKPLTRVLSHQYREDLKKAGIGDGTYSFRHIPSSLIDPERQLISAVVAGTDFRLPSPDPEPTMRGESHRSRMSGHFDFLAGNPSYRDIDIRRLNSRYRFIIEPFLSYISDSTILDLGSHDGRWPYAFSRAGAKRVIGIEARAELIAQFERFPNDAAKDRVELRQGDIFESLTLLRHDKACFDVVAILGIFYHITDHYGLLDLVRSLSPKLVIIDGAFHLASWPCVQIDFERADHFFNATSRFQGHRMVAVGIPSKVALERMAETLGYNTRWLDWQILPKVDRVGVDDYYFEGPQRRCTCSLSPTAQ